MKKLLMTLAVAGLMLTGCTKNETEGYNIPDPGVISFSTSTSRASINDLSTLMGDSGGFIIYGMAADAPTAWYDNVNGTNNYVYGTNWGWAGDNAEWPTYEAAYPMDFYAMYPAVAPSTASPGSLSGDIAIAATAATQVDMLAAKATAESKPASGQLTMTFDHILSKVNLGVIAGHDMTVEVQSAAVRNVHSENSYNYIMQTWSPGTSEIASYTYFSNTTTPFETTGITSEDKAVPFYTDTTDPLAADAHLMLMPQSSDTNAPAAWDKTAGTLETQAYIEVVYRIWNTTGDYIGFTDDDEYLEQPGAVDKSWGSYTGLGTGNNQYEGHLYVKVGFPLTLTWESGKGYTYNICLGTADSTNGYYTDDTYYDENGLDTTIPIVTPDGGDVVPGDPVTSGTINFLIDVNDWDDTTPATPLQ